MRAVQTGQKMGVRQTSSYQIDAPISVKIHTFIFLTNRWTHLGFFFNMFLYIYIFIFTVKYCLFSANRLIFTGVATAVSGCLYWDRDDALNTEKLSVGEGQRRPHRPAGGSTCAGGAISRNI